MALPVKFVYIPDIVLLTPDRFGIDREDYYNGAPTVVVEIRSPGDETWDKMDFYSRLGVPEVWVIDRDRRLPQLFQLADGDYEELPAAADDWSQSPITGVWLRQGETDKLDVQLGNNAASGNPCRTFDLSSPYMAASILELKRGL